MIVYEKSIVSTFQAVNDAVHDIVDALNTQCTFLDKHALFKISFMLREILNNAVEHGNHFDLSKLVTCKVVYDPPDITFEIEDEGEGIVLDKKVSAARDNLTENQDKLLRERHRGYQTIIEMAFRIDIVGTKVTITYHLNQEA